MTEAGSAFPHELAATVAYPKANRDDVIEDLHGHRVADPYRWLEDPEDTRTQEWSRAQDETARSWLDALPGRAIGADKLRALMRTGSVSVPLWRAGRAFFTRRAPEEELPVLYVREADGVERVLLNVIEIDPSGLTILDQWLPSLEGDRLAYKISVGGDEEPLLYVLDVDTGERVDGPIDRCRNSSLSWLPGGKEFFYVRQLAPDSVPAGEERFHRRVWRHQVGTHPEYDVLVHGEQQQHHTFYYGTSLSDDGRWLLVHGSPGTARRNAVWIADLAEDAPVPRLRQIVDTSEGVQASASVESDGRLYIHTTLGAPRWRVCVADPTRPEQAYWWELIPEEADSVLEGFQLFQGAAQGFQVDTERPNRLAVLRTRHAVSELTLHNVDTGELTDVVPLPGTGQVTALSTVDQHTGDEHGRLWIGWTDFTTPPCVHTYSSREAATKLTESAPGSGAALPVQTHQLNYQSRDGTTVRMFVLTAESAPTGPRPALLTGYGGFGLSMEPTYSPQALAWVAAGGVWAVASLRGGGEEGEQWHQAGMRENKQNVFDDFHAAARYLTDQGWTTQDRLAIMGGSNGGLLVGAALTQQPELYRAAVCSAPLLDMVRYEKFLLGRIWNEEYGTAADSEELSWLLSYSPYHRVQPSGFEPITYPSVLFTVFESDSRVDPSHARKMCAALQHATSHKPVERPVLLRRETQVGHSARSVSRTVGLAVDQLAFLAQATGLELE